MGNSTRACRRVLAERALRDQQVGEKECRYVLGGVRRRRSERSLGNVVGFVLGRTLGNGLGVDVHIGGHAAERAGNRGIEIRYRLPVDRAGSQHGIDAPAADGLDRILARQGDAGDLGGRKPVVGRQPVDQPVVGARTADDAELALLELPEILDRFPVLLGGDDDHRVLLQDRDGPCGTGDGQIPADDGEVDLAAIERLGGLDRTIARHDVEAHRGLRPRKPARQASQEGVVIASDRTDRDLELGGTGIDLVGEP